MNVTLRQLRALVALAHTGSFTQAAAVLHITQSALSGLIKELELQLGVRLVDRNTRSIALTQVGQGFVPLIEKVLQDLDGVLHGLDDLKALQRGMVRIAVPQLMACTLLPDVMAAFCTAHPGVQVRLVDCAVESVLARVGAGEVDFGIGPERATTTEIATQELFDMPFMVVFPPGHALQQCKRIGWRDVVQYPFIALQGQFTERLALDLHLARRELTLHSTHEVAFMTTALSMVSARQGVTACLPYAVSLVDLHQLEMRPVYAPELRRKFLVYRRASAALSPAAATFMEFLFAFVASHGWSTSAA
ncbi:LysR family transcriptional regulator [Simplicispira psychrophila]|uniref:LysR family transcriptional regulator n=1 Tax=Simplicispira psychrophila TaxID=80882 RepID=UPI000481A19F|nr:LysR family transcriptional regulator [Simplicispira psychrophila]